MLRELDRSFLQKLCNFVEDSRRQLVPWGAPISPPWGVSIAESETELSKAVSIPGSAIDAVAKAWEQISSRAEAADCTLYISLEPNPNYQQTPPVTETIRRIGFRRLVVGALDPYSRNTSKGVRYLEQSGLEIEVADGEQARLSQLLVDDYNKSINQFMPMFRVLCSLTESEKGLALHACPLPSPLFSNAVLCTDPNELESPFFANSWGLQLFPKTTPSTKSKKGVAYVIAKSEASQWDGVEEKLVISEAQWSEAAVSQLLKACVAQGIQSVTTYLQSDLWQYPLQLNLVDNFICYVSGNKFSGLERFSGVPVQLLGLGEGHLHSPTFLESAEKGFWLEAKIRYNAQQ